MAGMETGELLVTEGLDTKAPIQLGAPIRTLACLGKVSHVCTCDRHTGLSRLCQGPINKLRVCVWSDAACCKLPLTGGCADRCSCLVQTRAVLKAYMTLQGLAVGLDNGSVVIFHRESDEARTLTKLRTLTLGVNMGHPKGLPEGSGVPLSSNAVMAIAVNLGEDGLAVCTRDRRLLMITMPSLTEAAQA